MTFPFDEQTRTGTHGHRIMAENLAFWYLSIALEGLESWKDEITSRLSPEGKPTLDLECFLSDPPRQDELPPTNRCGDDCTKQAFCTQTAFPARIDEQIESFEYPLPSLSSLPSTLLQPMHLHHHFFL